MVDEIGLYDLGRDRHSSLIGVTRERPSGHEGESGQAELASSK